MNINISQAYAQKHPRTLINSFSDTYRKIFDILMDRHTRYGNTIPICQTTLAGTIGCTTRTVSRAFKLFRDLGLIFTTRRFNKSCIVTLTKFFKLPQVREALRAIRVALPLSMIFCPMFQRENVYILRQGTYPDPVSQLFRIGLNRSSENERRANRDKKVNEVTIRKILDIERALVARGESLETMDTEKLAAFPMECLDDVSAQMKKAHPKQPFGFFLHLCMKWCKENNQEPVFGKADALRQLGLLAKFRESGRPAGIAEQIKAREPQRVNYSQQVQETRARENAAAEARTRRFSEVQLVDEIAGLKWHVENLTERANKGEPGMVTALMIAKGSLERRLYELSSTHPELYKISTETKVHPVSHTNTAPPTQIVEHMANLFANDFSPEPEESDYDEDVLD